MQEVAEEEYQHDIDEKKSGLLVVWCLVVFVLANEYSYGK